MKAMTARRINDFGMQAVACACLVGAGTPWWVALLVTSIYGIWCVYNGATAKAVRMRDYMAGITPQQLQQMFKRDANRLRALASAMEQGNKLEVQRLAVQGLLDTKPE
jgi:hypothetical protein